MRHAFKFFTALLIFCSYHSSFAQFSFTDRSHLLSETEHFSGVAMGIIDMNGDGLDDIVRQNFAKDLNIELQNLPNQGFESIVGPSTGSSRQWSMCMGDIDNNGTNEILTGGLNDEILVIELEDGNTFKKYELPQAAGVFVQGSNFADINNDGFIDAFVCHDNGESRIWGNDGAGGFTTNDEWIDMSINGDSGEIASGNYGSTWVDVDNDGDIDLYIAKCRQGVFDDTDKRRINQLYINDGEGNFTEEAHDRGLAVGWQSWTAEFQDINNDGWLDCFVTNHDYRSQIFMNDGDGYFSELLSADLNIQGLVIQGLMKDFDNDGWVDIITTGSKGQIFRNNGDLSFTEIPNLFDDKNMESLAIGDLNNDGYLDIYGGYAMPFNNPSSVSDKLWMNDGGDNNYFAVTLVGVESNRNAIGARVEIYGDWGLQVREVRAGESYGIANSNISYFGVGSAESVDSITVKWPSGLIQTEYNLKSNSKIRITEGQCLGESPDITISGPTTFCMGDSVTLSVDGEFESYVWSNGADVNAITVSNSGNFSLEVIDADGCIGYSENIAVSVDPVQEPVVVTSDVTEFCRGESIVLEVVNVDVEDSDIVWTTGDTGYNLEVTETGVYFANVEGLCSDFESNSLEVIVNEIPDAPEALGDSIKLGEVAILTGEGNNLAWFDSESNQSPIGFGQSIEVPGLTSNTSFFVENRAGSGINGKVGMEDHAGTLYTPNADQNNALRFDVFKAMRLDSVKVYTDLPGIRRILITDQFGGAVSSISVDIEEGESTIYLGFEIAEGENYLLTTDFFQNLETTGNFGPRLQRSSEDVDFPYEIDDVVTIKGGNFGQDFYYYFYDWSISAGVFCPSERTEVSVVVNEPLATEDEYFDYSLVYPNPSNGKFMVRLSQELSSQAECTVVDLSGKIMHQSEISDRKNFELELDLLPGLYFLRIVDGEKAISSKIVIEN